MKKALHTIRNINFSKLKQRMAQVSALTKKMAQAFACAPRRTILAQAIVAVLILSSCQRENNPSGYTYFPDMTYSRAYETYSENPVLENGTENVPVTGTVPRGMIPFPYEKTDADLARAGREVGPNPLEPTEENLARGKEMFGRTCQQCHGENGDGQGFLFTSGLYIYQPASLIAEQAVNRPDGELYHIISVGRNVMGEQGSLLRPEDRWKIILHVRTLQAVN